MASSPNASSPTTTWSAFSGPDESTLHRMRHSCEHDTVLTPCGVEWDAIVVAPLDRGLAALDLLGLHPEDGLAVLADYARRELIVLATVSSAQGFTGVPGVRLLSHGTWLLVPARRLQPHYAATWLSYQGDFGSRFLDPAALRGALLRLDATDHRPVLAAPDRAVVGQPAEPVGAH